jgi:nucleotide-binding universal stress UspA family protein
VSLQPGKGFGDVVTEIDRVVLERDMAILSQILTSTAPNRYLVAVDGSNASRIAILNVLKMMHREDILHLLLLTPSRSHYTPTGMRATHVDRGMTHFETLLANLRVEGCPILVERTLSVSDAFPGKEICRIATNIGATYIALGTFEKKKKAITDIFKRGRSVHSYVRANAPCPVLFVRDEPTAERSLKMTQLLMQESSGPAPPLVTAQPAPSTIVTPVVPPISTAPLVPPSARESFTQSTVPLVITQQPQQSTMQSGLAPSQPTGAVPYSESQLYSVGSSSGPSLGTTATYSQPMPATTTTSGFSS